jgi:hypothetical protein
VLSQVLDRVVAFAARDEAQLVRAREEWATQGGRVLDDSPLYEERTAAFLEWFALERRIGGARLPVERFLAEEPLGDLDGKWADALARAHRSLFTVRELKPGVLVLDDILGGGAFEVTERRRMPGVVEGELFEARLVADVATPPAVLFTRGFQFHPREAAAEARRLAQGAWKAGEPRADVLFRLMRLRLKALQYGHVSAGRIYSDPEE